MIAWNKITAESITQTVEQIKNQTEKIYQQVLSIPSSQRTFENTIQLIINHENDMDSLNTICTIPSQMFTEKKIIDASLEAKKQLSDFDIECSSKKEIYELFQFIFNQYTTSETKSNTKLTSEQQKYLDKCLLEFKRNGLNLSDEKINKIKELNKLKENLAIDFENNLNNYNPKTEFSLDELKGVPEDVLKQFTTIQKENETYYSLGASYPNYFPIMENCSVEETRKKMTIVFHGACIDKNLDILQNISKIRKEIANLQGYDTYADFILEVRMAKNKKNVFDFYENLLNILKNPWQKEYQQMLQMKRDENNDQKINKLEIWDPWYYSRKMIQRDCDLNMNDLRKYFPAETVTKGILEIYQKLLSMRFEEEKTDNVWHESVKYYKVYDKESKNLMGSFYLDLFPRQYKYTHACCTNTLNYCKLSNGEIQLPQALLLCNFSTDGLLEFKEVEVFLHEFGHCMHVICAKSDIVKLSDFDYVETDFVEAPSQMLENWCYEDEPLQMMSCHVETKESISKEIVNKINKMSKIGKAFWTMRQINVGLMDMYLYTTHWNKDLNETYKELMELTLNMTPPENTNFYARFAHLVGEYASGYYGYLYSDVFAADMFYTKFKNNLFDSKNGLEYRKEILEPASSRDSYTSLIKFLGREPNGNAFFNELI